VTAQISPAVEERSSKMASFLQLGNDAYGRLEFGRSGGAGHHNGTEKNSCR
jgi:hypothetical protein